MNGSSTIWSKNILTAPPSPLQLETDRLSIRKINTTIKLTDKSTSPTPTPTPTLQIEVDRKVTGLVNTINKSTKDQVVNEPFEDSKTPLIQNRCGRESFTSMGTLGLMTPTAIPTKSFLTRRTWIKKDSIIPIGDCTSLPIER